MGQYVGDGWFVEGPDEKKEPMIKPHTVIFLVVELLLVLFLRGAWCAAKEQNHAEAVVAAARTTMTLEERREDCFQREYAPHAYDDSMSTKLVMARSARDLCVILHPK